MSFYLKDIPLIEAQKRFESALRSSGKWGVLGFEEIPVDEQACGRILTDPVWAKISSPHYHAAAMDGFAVRSIDTMDAMLTLPVVLRLNINDVLPKAAYVDTGDPLPGWADAVIPIENVEPLDDQNTPAIDPRRPDSIRIRSGVAPWVHVRLMGEDMVATQLVLPAGHQLRPVDLGAIAASGNSTVMVSKQPRVAIIPTGTELVSIGADLKPGQIIEFNSIVLASQVNDAGGIAVRLPITKDDKQLLTQRVKEAAEKYDLILLIAGSSAGAEDFSAEVIDSLGVVLVHGIAIRPGHPVILGKIGSKQFDNHDDVPIIGIPGYPVSATLTGEIFVSPLLKLWLGKPEQIPETLNAITTRKITSPGGDDDYLRVTVGKVGERYLASPLPRGSGLITSLVRADGLVIIPRGSQGYSAGKEVVVRLYRPISEIDNSIQITGSHDMTIDLLSAFLSKHRRRLTSTNVGSLGGLMALRQGIAHLAGSHLLDPTTGEYNLSYIQKYLAGMRISIINFVQRQQGILVKKGNPKNITRLDDLTRQNIIFVNRQRGAGTRVLLDFYLDKLALERQVIRGYDQEEYTHLAVAAAIASGRADCGLGIAAAASALDLDFIPLYIEKFDLVIPTEYLAGNLFKPLLDILNEPNFQRMILEMPGYSVDQMGKVSNIQE